MKSRILNEVDIDDYALLSVGLVINVCMSSSPFWMRVLAGGLQLTGVSMSLRPFWSRAFAKLCVLRLCLRLLYITDGLGMAIGHSALSHSACTRLAGYMLIHVCTVSALDGLFGSSAAAQ